MKLSLKWLNDHIAHSLSPEELATLLTNTGLEVEHFENYSTMPWDMEGVVVGHVEKVWSHPNADKLNLTMVNIGQDEPLQIVCGAPNIAENQKVPVATIGTRIPLAKGEELKIKKGKLRGEASFGMICSEAELGISDNHDGIMVLKENATPGTPMRNLLPSYQDHVLDIGLTPNRVDAASHRGAALDVAASIKKPLVDSPVAPIQASDKNPHYDITVASTEDCPRYAALVINDVQVKPSPDWMKNRLKAIGIQPKNVVVDVTNYVMHDMGQPLHAFDFNELAGAEVVVRTAKKGERLQTLDGENREMEGFELLVCDQIRPMALAGIMGGKESAVKEGTTTVLLESAHFHPGLIRKAAKTHQMHTDASFRFERGADPNAVVKALQRAAYLLQECGVGKWDKTILDSATQSFAPKKVLLSLDYCRKLSGLNLSESQIEEVLNALCMPFEKQTDGKLLVEVPTNKPDVTRPCDVVEEIMRIVGFDAVPYNMPLTSSLPKRTYQAQERTQQRLSELLNGLGFHQFKTAPLQPSATGGDLVKLANPLSNELESLRPSLLLSGLPAILHNVNRQMPNIKAFEWGTEYQYAKSTFNETGKLVIWATGLELSEAHWHSKSKEIDVYYLAGVVNQLLEAAGITPPHYEAVLDEGNWEFGISHVVEGDNKVTIGQVSPEKLAEYDLEDTKVIGAEIDTDWLDTVSKMGQVTFSSLSRYPFVTRDISFLLSSDVRYAAVRNRILQLNIPFLQGLSCFDVYKGEHTQNMVSYAIRLRFQDENKTMKDKQVDHFMQQVMKSLEDLGCEIRK